MFSSDNLSVIFFSFSHFQSRLILKFQVKLFWHFLKTYIISVAPLFFFSRILGQIVDSLDNLIDEWYPGLTCIDPMMGQEVLEILAPCSQCEGMNAGGRILYTDYAK